MGRGRFAQWLLASLVVAMGLGACVSETVPTEDTSQSASAVTAPAGLPCAARANAVIANTANAFSNSGSLVDSYKSSVGKYGGTNVDSNGDVQAAESIVHNGGIIDGTQTPDVAAGLAIVPVPSGATSLPLGSKTPGSLDITTAAESITLAPGNYVVANLTVASPGAIAISPAGAVQIWVTGNLNLGGNENLNGVPDNFAVLVTSSGSVNVNGSGELFGFIYAPTSTVSLESTVFGGVVGTTVNLNAGSSVHFDQSSVCAVADAGSDAAHDALPDVSSDAADASRDVSVDAAVEAGPDSAHDASVDVSIDAPRDVSVEAAADGSSGSRDASIDVSIDVSVDVATDSTGSGGGGLDAAAAPDVSVDVAIDVGVDAPTCTPASCATNTPCFLDTCNADGTCSHTPLTGTTCSTGNACFGVGTCEAGACVGTTPIACTASDQCHIAGTCDPTTGACSNPTVPDGTTCNDDNACTQSDTCVAGACTGSNPVVCTASDACHGVGTCDPTSGVCSNPVIACNDAGTPMLAGPTLNGTVASNLSSMAAPLFTTSDGGTGAINLAHVAVIRGHVFALPNGGPFAGVTLSVLGHPEFPTAISGSDGSFNLAVNGGGQLTVVYTAPSGTPTYLPVQRHTPTQWQEWAVLPDVYMTPEDPNATPVAMSSTSWQAAQGSTITDPADLNGLDGGPPVSPTGPHTARIFFPAGTTSSLTYGACGGSGAPGSTCSSGPTQTCAQGTCVAGVCTGAAPPSLTVRATEYTVGSTGLAAMPAELPPNTGYTYAVELSADEAMAAGATGVSFNQPVSFYVEDFIGFGSAQAGTANPPVPVGYYDKSSGQWVPSPNGNVLQIMGFSGTCPGAGCVAVVNQPATSDAGASVELSADELAFLGQTYQGVATPLYLWRFTMQHFSSWDTNWPYGPPPNAPGPPGPPPTPDPPPPDPDPCNDPNGSIIECENQILAQEIAVPGTPYSLRYQSERAPGRVPGIQIPITGAIWPPSGAMPLRVDVQIAIAGQSIAMSYPASTLVANQTVPWTWNQQDTAGNTLVGLQKARVSVAYVYQAQYLCLSFPPILPLYRSTCFPRMVRL